MSYRLNVFGFPGARGARENAGFHDARLVYVFMQKYYVLIPNKLVSSGQGTILRLLGKRHLMVYTIVLLTHDSGDTEQMVLWGQSAGRLMSVS